MELKDEEIKKALEEFQNRILNTNLSFHIFESEREALKEALALFNRQQAKIERYEKESNKQFDKIKLLDDRIKQRYAELFEEAKEFIRAEAIKEFAELIVADCPEMEFCLEKLLAKMAGGENAKSN